MCLSFAGENRRIVQPIAKRLASEGLRVFYDQYERADLWGKDLYSHLDEVYGGAARYCVLFISKHYAQKLWANHERKSAQARAFKQHAEYILPVRLDDTEIPGLPSTVGYIDLRQTTTAELVRLIIKKIGKPELSFYLPPNPDRLFKRIGAKTALEKQLVHYQAGIIIENFRRMTKEERRLVGHLFLHGCSAELPENIHISTTSCVDIRGFQSLR